jgi:hypothetical protein
MKKTAIVLALGLAFGVAASANAAVVTGITIQDVGSTLNGVDGGGGTGTYSPALDGKSGGFRFNLLNPTTYFGASLFTGNVGTGTIIAQGAANPVGSFSTGFLFSGAPFVPYTFGSGVNADITAGALTVSSMNFGGQFAGANNFNLAPDVGTLKVNWVNQIGSSNDYNVSFQWEHMITAAEDPSGNFAGFNARWLIEGVAHTAPAAVPLPAAVWLLGSGLIGMVGVARRRKSGNTKAA